MLKWSRWFASFSVILLVSFLLPAFTWGATPYEGYTISTSGRDVRSLNGYLYKTSIDGVYYSFDTFRAPESLFITEDDHVYIVDTGNSRIVHLDAQHRYVRTLGDEDGPGRLNEPKGMYVKPDGTIYVADTKNQRIVVFSKEGSYLKEFTASDSPLLGSGFSYSPSKLILDKRDYMYVVSDGNTQGLLQIDPNGEFKGFYGANHIGFSWSRLLVRLIATEEQKRRLTAVRPAEFSNLEMDEEGFIYTTTLGEQVNQLKRLSPVGVDTLNTGGDRLYGDSFHFGPFQVPSFIGITVSEKGIISALDLQTGKVFQYDKLGNFLFAFGGIGEQNGLFVTPSDIAQASNGDIYVVDRGRHRIDIFRTTPFAELVHLASELYVDGRYDEAEELWMQVLAQNANFEMAYLAIGKALYNAERYKEALDYFKLARSRGDYSLAFKEYRKEVMRENFSYIFVGVIVLFFVIRLGFPRMFRWLHRKLSHSPPIDGMRREV